MGPQSIGEGNAYTSDFSPLGAGTDCMVLPLIMDLDGDQTSLRLGPLEFLFPVIIIGETDTSVGKKGLYAPATLFLLPLENFKFFFCHSTKNDRVYNPAKLQTLFPVLKVYFS